MAREPYRFAPSPWRRVYVPWYKMHVQKIVLQSLGIGFAAAILPPAIYLASGNGLDVINFLVFLCLIGWIALFGRAIQLYGIMLSLWLLVSLPLVLLWPAFELSIWSACYFHRSCL